MSTTAAKVLSANWVNGKEERSQSGRTLPLFGPWTGEVLGEIPMSSREELSHMVDIAAEAQKSWAEVPLKERVQVLYRVKEIFQNRADEIAQLVSRENGKCASEAKAGIMRGLECVEFAASLPQVTQGGCMTVSPGVECRSSRHPLGVVAGITPFNFPAMVPLWMIPLALACGNSFVLKPSEQTPLSAIEIARCFQEAGLPDGLLNIIQGDREIVEAICEEPRIQAVGFVGSSYVAKRVYETASAHGKRVRCMGGAKNHLILMPDADPEMAAANILASSTGCSGQRCMAASMLIAVGDVEESLTLLKEKMAAIIPGKDIGPLISKQAKERVLGYLDRAEKSGARLLVDGRNVSVEGNENGYFLGASLIEVEDPQHEAAQDEIFGPVLTMIRCKTLDEALAIENESPYGNGASIYTSSGALAEVFTHRAQSGMLGINIGVPVPREPYPFGGWNASRFGDGPITGEEAVSFWSQAKTITTKWTGHASRNWMS